MKPRIIILAILTLLPVITGCSNRFRLKSEAVGLPSAWLFPRRTTAAVGAVSEDSSRFTGKLDTLWHIRFGDKPAGPLALSHGMLVYPSSRKRLRFVDLATGKNLGFQRTKGTPQTGAILADSIAFFGLMPPSDQFTALDLRHRKTRWTYPIKDPSAGSIIVNGLLICSSVAGQVSALSLLDGKQKWQMEAGGRLLGPVSGHDSLIVVATDRSELVAISSVDGRVRWRAAIGGPGVAEAVIADLIFVTDVRGHVQAVRPDDGAVVWQTQLGGPIWGSPALGADRLVVGHSGGEIVALDRATGERLWSFATIEVVRSSPVIVGDYVVAGTMGGKLFSLRLSDGSLVARQQMNGALEYGPVTDGHYVYVATQTGRIVCYGEHNGQLPQGRH